MANYNSSHTGAEIDSAIGRVKDTAVTAGTVAASLGVVVDANKDISGFRNVTLTGQLQAATINLTGDTTIGDGDSDNITINADVNSNIIPNTDNTFDLGSASKQWKDLYVNGIGYIDQLGTDADPIAIYASSGEIDGTAIGSESASTGAFTTINASGNITGNLVGNVTGNVSGTAATVTGGTQASITSAANLVTVGTIGTGVWQGTKVASAYLDDDTAHLSTTQTFSGAKTFTANPIIQSDTGTLNFYNAAGAQRAFLQLSGTGLVIDTDSFLEFKPNNTTAMYIDSSQRVGIGTTSPKSIIHASDGTASGITARDDAMIITHNGNPKLVFEDASEGSGDKVMLFNYFDETLHISSMNDAMDGWDNIYIASFNRDGKVGIGTNSPAYTLDLASSDAIVSQFTGSSGETILSLDNTSTNGDKWYLISGGSGGSFSGGKFGIFNADTTTAVATFTNDGNVGVGTTSPNISGWNANYAVLTIKGDTTNYGGVLELANPDSTGNYFGTVSFVNMDGGSSTVANARISGTRDGVDDASALTFETEPTGGAVTERARINSGGDILFHSDNGITTKTGTDAGSGILAGGASFQPNSVGRSILYLGTYNYTSAASVARFTNQNGVVGSIDVNGSSTAFSTSSDYRLKENQVLISDGLTRLNQLKPYRFNFKADADTTVDGFFAHEVSDIVPEAVFGEKDAVNDDDSIKSQRIDQSKLVPLLVKALQEADDKIDALTTRIEALEA